MGRGGISTPPLHVSPGGFKAHDLTDASHWPVSAIDD